MASKKVFVHLDMNKQELQNSKAQNVTSTEKTTLAATLVAADKGLFVYDTTLLKLFVWSGTAFVDQTPAPPTVGQYRGGVAHTAAVPANLVSGDWVIFTSAGTLTNFVAGQVVQIADLAFYNGTTWNLVQGNVVMATDTVAGVIRIATYGETSSFFNDDSAVTPVRMGAALNQYFQQDIIDLVANTTTFIQLYGSRTISQVQFFINNAGVLEPIELEWFNNLATFKLEVRSNISLTSIVSRIIYHFSV
jgi:hypothetical protein